MIRSQADSGLTLTELEDQLRQATRWHRRAACRPSALPPGVDSTWFIPTVTAGDHNPQSWYPKAAAAARICRHCPVRDTCAAEGSGEAGIWGGRLQRRMYQVSDAYEARSQRTFAQVTETL